MKVAVVLILLFSTCLQLTSAAVKGKMLLLFCRVNMGVCDEGKNPTKSIKGVGFSVGKGAHART